MTGTGAQAQCFSLRIYPPPKCICFLEVRIFALFLLTPAFLSSCAVAVRSAQRTVGASGLPVLLCWKLHRSHTTAHGTVRAGSRPCFSRLNQLHILSAVVCFLLLLLYFVRGVLYAVQLFVRLVIDLHFLASCELSILFMLIPHEAP